jgi:hypothetical protein
VNRRRALDAVAGEHAAGQRHPGALVGRLVEAQREASRLRDRHDSFINEADGRDPPVDLKPQPREVRSKATGFWAARPVLISPPDRLRRSRLSRLPPAFFHHAHSSSVLLKVMLEQLRRSCL